MFSPREQHCLSVRSLAAFLVACAMLLSPPLRAYHRHLSQEEVTEAYYLGQRRDSQLGAFFDSYQRNFPGPREAGDYVSAVVIRTPYALAVLRSASSIGHYTAQDAWQDYKAAPDEFEVIAYLDYSYGNKSAPPSDPPVARDPVRGYYVRVKQWREGEERTLVAQDAHLERGIMGVYEMPESLQIHATFRVQDIDSSDLTIEVTIPTGRRVVVTYNLDDLR
jgi:hypothetical protein